MNKINKVLIFCLVAVFSLMLAGCSENTDIKNESSDVSLTVSGESEKPENEGTELPEEEFDSTQESGNSQNTNTNKEDDGKTSPSEQGGSQSSSSTVGATSSEQDEESSKTESVEDNTSSDTDTSEPSQNEDGSIELPMDMW